MERQKEYIGDSVYAEYDPATNQIILTTENGLGPSNIIILEPEVYDALVNFANRIESQ
jgi:hypothetical protein